MMNWSSLKSNSISTVVTINAINFFLINSFVAQQLIPLNEYIKHYEPLTYDTRVVLSRAKRSLLSQLSSNSEPIIFEFKSHGRHFRIRLRRDYSSVFHKNLIIESSDGKPIKVNLDHIVSGELAFEPRSKVFGSISDGVFEGQIHTQNDQTFYIEKAVKYFNNSNDVNNNKTSFPFHSVIYSATDVTDPYLHKRSIIDREWGTNQNVNEWMDRISSSGVGEEKSSSDSLSRNKLAFGSSPNDWKTNFEAKRRIGSKIKASHKTNHDIPYVPQKRVCSLYIQTDTYLWDEIKKKESSETKAREEVVSLVAQHIKAVNHIYESTVFKDIYGLKFIVKRLRIDDMSACDSQLKRDSNQFCSPDIDFYNFLDMNSILNHNDFCLSYIFTYRHFSNDTLGGAYTGGVCDKSINVDIGLIQVKLKLNLNIGFITFLNYNSRIPPKMSELLLAHEIGHNFGSSHDPSECTPGGSQGNFLMYPYITSGEKPNNNQFSICSINNISLVLHSIFNNEVKDNCFEEDNEPFCGNKIVENGEECDCGYDSKQCNEKCCYPRKVEPFIPFEPKAKACHRRQSFKCSPSEGLCCSDTCEFETRTKQCRPESECNLKSFCNGYNAYCPRSQPKPNKTKCNGGTQVCWSGKCVGNHEKQDDNHIKVNSNTFFVIIAFMIIFSVSALIYYFLNRIEALLDP